MREITKLRARRFPVMESNGTGKVDFDSTPLPNARWYPGGDAYFHYRSMVMAASFPDKPTIPPYGASADEPFSAAYTPEEDDMIYQAAKLCGYTGKRLGTPKSKESDDVHRVSPVHNWRNIKKS